MFRSSLLILTFIVGAYSVPMTAQIAHPGSSETSPKVLLTISISGVHSNKGQLMVWVWDGPEGFPKKDDKAKLRTIPATKLVNSSLTVSFDVPPGTYAVTVLHDENGNGKMDANMLGIPKEGIGTSNNVQSHLHAPSFDQAKFEVPPSGKAISISMRY